MNSHALNISVLLSWTLNTTLTSLQHAQWVLFLTLHLQCCMSLNLVLQIINVINTNTNNASKMRYVDVENNSYNHYYVIKIFSLAFSSLMVPFSWIVYSIIKNNAFDFNSYNSLRNFSISWTDKKYWIVGNKWDSGCDYFSRIGHAYKNFHF